MAVLLIYGALNWHYDTDRQYSHIYIPPAKISMYTEVLV